MKSTIGEGFVLALLCLFLFVIGWLVMTEHQARVESRQYEQFVVAEKLIERTAVVNEGSVNVGTLQIVVAADGREFEVHPSASSVFNKLQFGIEYLCTLEYGVIRGCSPIGRFEQ